MGHAVSVSAVCGDLRNGDAHATLDALPILYEELRHLAAHLFRGQDLGHTLQPTALVHELWIRLANQPRDILDDPQACFAVGAQVIRTILIDHARRKLAVKRGGAWKRLSTDKLFECVDARTAWLIELDDALSDLKAVDAELHQVVELRFFGGLSIDEAAQVLGSSPMTVKRQWRVARAWLHQAIGKD